MSTHHAAALRGHCHDPHTQVAHRAAVCARPARPRLPTSTATTRSDVRQPAAAQERAHGRCSPGLHKKARRTPPRSAMTVRARWIPTFSTHVQPPSLRLITTRPPLLARLCLRPSQEPQYNARMRQAQPRASSSAFGACVLTYPVDLEPLVRCVCVCVMCS